ncbi:MAG: DNA polymerase IV [Desulfovibrio sp.]|jgi:DNA polymerase-4|nr:DNA polymerase IV [Desulfovibrio sp.]
MDESPPRWILHLDMDAFYASVEQLDNPDLRGKPVIIGAGARGVVSTASYEARKYGVRSAMPIFEARRLCPKGVFLPGRMRRYVEKSREIMARLQLYSPLVQPASIDEAYLDATGLELVFASAENMARVLQKDIYETCGLSCSIGLAPVKFLAKIASDLQKPAGLTILRHADVPAFLDRLPIGKIPGVGPGMLKKLELMNMRFAGDIQRYPQDFWEKHLGKAGNLLFERACGVDPRSVHGLADPKSESAENTFAADTKDPVLLSAWLLRQAERVGKSLRRQGLSGRTVTLKIKYADFTQSSKSRTLENPVNSTRAIYETALDLLSGCALQKPLRLIGLGVSKFDTKLKQLPLLSNPAAQQGALRDASLDAALDRLREKFGNGAVVRGKLFDFDGKI